MKITAKNLTRVYKGGVYALDGFSAEFDDGDFVCVLGESGCGKTTLLRCLSGLDKPTAGELYFDGTLFSDIPIKDRDTGIVFQDYVLYPKMTVWENVAMALARYDLPRKKVDGMVYEALSQFGMLPFRNQLPRFLSGGQQQRVALARAVVKSPTLLLFDEPLSNIAEEQRQEYLQTIRDLRERLPKTTFVYVTHNVHEALALGDKLLIMRDGRTVRFGAKEQVWKDPYAAEVLRGLGGCDEETATVKDGVAVTKSGREIPAKNVPDGEFTVIYNIYDEGAPVLFGADEEALTGERRINFFDGFFDGRTLSFGNVTVDCDEEFRARMAVEAGDVRVGLVSRKLRTFPRYGDVVIPAAETAEGFLIDGTTCPIVLRNTTGFEGNFYIAPAELKVFRDGRSVFAEYKVYQPSCKAKRAGDFIRLPSGRLYAGAGEPVRSIRFKKDAYAAIVRKGGLRADCIFEEDAGDVRRAYLVIKGFGSYVTVTGDRHARFFTDKRLRIKLAREDIIANGDQQHE